MSLQLKFGLCVINGCTQLKFEDNTGAYDATNLTGWGAPNPVIASADTATLKITNPSNISYIIDLVPQGFPSEVKNTAYIIPLSDIGNPTYIVDGQWYFNYTVILNDTTVYTTEIYKYFYCNLECCVNTMLTNVDVCDCSKSNTSSNDYVTASTFLQSLKNAAKCGASSTFTALKKIIDKLCKNSGCKTCK